MKILKKGELTMDFVKVLEDWLADPANADNYFYNIVEVLTGIIAFIASL